MNLPIPLKKEQLHRPPFFILLAVVALVCVFLRVRPLMAEREMITFRTDNGTFPCDRGIYVLHVEYQADNDFTIPAFTIDEEENVVLLGNSNILHHSHTSADLRLYVPENNTQAQFYTHPTYEDSNVRIDHIDIIYLSGTSVAYYALRTLVPFLVLLGLLLFVRIFGRASEEGKRVILCLGGLIFFISLPLFVEYILAEQDYYFHMSRIGALAQGIKSGRFPVRLYPVVYHDYGYPPGVMYGDLFLYAPALLHLLGVPLWRCYQLFLFAANTALVLTSRYAFRKISGNAMTGVYGSALYSTSIYFLTNVYYRNAVGEYCAMIFVPLVLLGFWQLFGEKPKDAAAPLVIGFTGLIQTHLLSTLMCFLFGLLLCLICIRRLLRQKRLPIVFSAAGVTLLMNAGFIVPFLEYYLTCDFVIHNDYHMDPRTGASIPQLFMTDYTASDGFYDVALSLKGEMPVTPGLPVMLVLILTLCFLLLAKKGTRPKRICIGFAISLLALFMGTRLFPYAAIEHRLPWLYAVIGRSIQFPSRYFVIVIPVTCMLALLLFREYHKGQTARTAKMILYGLILLSLWQGLNFMSRRLHETEGKQDLSLGEVRGIGDTLYLFWDANGWEAVKDRSVHTSPAMTLRDEVRDEKAFRYAFHATNGETEEGWADLPVWNYPHYAAQTSDGQTLAVSDGENHRVRVTLPASFDGDVTVGFREPWYWRFAELLSVATATCLLILRKRFLPPPESDHTPQTP